MTTEPLERRGLPRRVVARTAVHHHRTTAALLVFLFWIAAAVVVITCRLELARWPSAGAIATIASVVGAAWAYMRLCAPHARIDHALGVGIAWLVLATVAEIAVTTTIGRGWYALIGTPDRPLLRNLSLFVWVFAPVLFARGAPDERT